MNRLFPFTWKHSDVYSERIKAFILFSLVISVIMMITSPSGWLYACFPRPVTALFLMMNNIHFDFPTAEWGMHWLTIFVYGMFAFYGIEYFEYQGIVKPFHKLSYIISLTLLTFYTPFEWVYISLVDIFHNMPIYNLPMIWMFGYWKDTFGFITESVIGVDGGITISCIIVLYLLKKDLNNYYKTKFQFNKKSLLLFSLFIISMALWIIIPLHQDVPSFGTKWFPQTIYVKYGRFEDYDMPIPPNGDIMGIVEEYWFPNDIIKYHNHIAKLFSVAFMFYTFIPRVVRKNEYA